MQNYIKCGPWRYVVAYRNPDLPGFEITTRSNENAFFNEGKDWVVGYTAALPSYDKAELWSSSARYIEIPKTGSRSIASALGRMISDTAPIPFYGHMYGRSFPNWLWPSLRTMIRNPYDRVVSAYYFMKSGGFNSNAQYLKLTSIYQEFDHFVMDFLNFEHMAYGCIDSPYSTRWRAAPWREIFVRQTEWLTDQTDDIIIPAGNMARFENFESDLLKVFGCSGVERRNSSKEKLPFQEYYSRGDVRRKVYELYAKDFDLLGYSEQI